MVRPKSPETQKLRERAVELLLSGHTQAEVAKILGRDIRTIQKWVALPEVKVLLEARGKQRKALVQSDPVVLSVVDIRSQVQEILDYRDSQRSFAVEMGAVIQKATAILAKVVEQIEQNPEQVTARTLPQLMRAVADTAEKVSNAWARATGLDDLLEQIGNEPKAVESGEKED